MKEIQKGIDKDLVKLKSIAKDIDEHKKLWQGYEIHVGTGPTRSIDKIRKKLSKTIGDLDSTSKIIGELVDADQCKFPKFGESIG